MNDAAPTSGYAEAYAAWRADPEAWWAGRRRGHHLGAALGPRVRSLERAVRPLVPRCDAEHLLQLRRPPRAGRPRRAGGADLGQPDDRADRDLHLSPDADAHREAGRRAGGTRRDAWRPGGDLPADGAGGGDRHAGLRPAGRDPFRGVRRLRRGRTGLAHRRRQAEGDRVGVLRPRAGTRGEIQAAARRGDRAVAAQARRLPDPAARCRTRRTGRRARPRSGGGRGGRGAARSGRRWRPPIRSTSSTPPARRDGRRAWCATMAATPSRCGTRCACSTASRPATCTGRRPTSAGWSATPTSSTRRCCAAAPA